MKFWMFSVCQVADEYDFPNFAYSAHMPSVENTSCIAIAHETGDLRLIDIRTGSNSHIIHSHNRKGVCLVKWFNNNSNLLASGG